MLHGMSEAARYLTVLGEIVGYKTNFISPSSCRCRPGGLEQFLADVTIRRVLTTANFSPERN